VEEERKSLAGDGLLAVVSLTGMDLDTDDKGTQFSTGATEFLLGKLWGGGLGVPTIFA
jgi:hypothetical protein